MVKLSSKNYPLERLAVDEEIASTIFQHNKYKLEQIPAMVEQSSGNYKSRFIFLYNEHIILFVRNLLFLDKSVILYRIGEHIDISRGPVVGNVNFLGRCTITAVS